MELSPLKRYLEPDYPARDILDANPELLKIVPNAWRSNPRVLTALALTLGMGSSMYVLAAETIPQPSLGSPAVTIRYLPSSTRFFLQPMPVIRNTMLVPLRLVAEPLGATVTYDAQSETAILFYQKSKVVFTPGRKITLVDGMPVEMPVAARKRRDGIYVPLRFLADRLSANLAWDAQNGQAILYPQGAGNPMVFNTRSQQAIINKPQNKARKHSRRVSAVPTPDTPIAAAVETSSLPRISKQQVQEFIGWLKAEGIV